MGGVVIPINIGWVCAAKGHPGINETKLDTLLKANTLL